MFRDLELAPTVILNEELAFKMFQSSDDDDLNVEVKIVSCFLRPTTIRIFCTSILIDSTFQDLLNVPQEKSIFKNEDSPKSSTKLDDFNTILDDFDDNELILSVIDNVDNSIINEPVKQSFGNGHQKIINIIKKTLQTNTPIETRTATPTKTSIQSTSKQNFLSISQVFFVMFPCM